MRSKDKHRSSNIFEGAEKGDLVRLVEPVLAIDEFRSKMGEDKDIVVLGVTVFGKEPAGDVVDFVEKSYDWVLDADISSGETADGNYVVFIEIERDDSAIEHIITTVTDICRLSDQTMEDWSFTYYTSPKKYPVTSEVLAQHVISSPDEYEAKMSDDLKESARLNGLRSLAGLPHKAKSISDPILVNIQTLAGIK